MLFSKKVGCLLTPCTGKSIPLSEVEDEAFASGMLGMGFGVEPIEGRVCAPVGGLVESVADAKHAYTIQSDDGLDVLVHVGVDTVTLGGEGFTPKVKAGQHVCAGDVLAEVSLELLREKALPQTVVVLVTEPDRITNIEYRYGSCVCAKDAVMCFRVRKER